MIHTIRRYGGYEAVVQSLGFIPFSQWNYFCRFYLLMKASQPVAFFLFWFVWLLGREEMR
jgi:hypothetical protein